MEESGSQGIRLIEDSTEDYIVAQYILRQVTDRPIMRCRDGESALDYLLHREPMQRPRTPYTQHSSCWI
jgi:hypothetical protein